jgi:hypothetical protein
VHNAHNHTHVQGSSKSKEPSRTTIEEPITEPIELKNEQETDPTTNPNTTNATPEEKPGVETRSKRKTIAKESADSSTRKSSSNKRRKKNKQERLKQQSAANHEAKTAPPQTPATTGIAKTTRNTPQEDLGRGKRFKTKRSKQMENEANIFSVLLLNIVTNLWLSL